MVQHSRAQGTFTVVTALAVDALARGSATQDGRAADIAADGKRRNYPLLNVTPFAIEDHGRFGDSALGFVRAIAPALASERSAAIASLYHRLSATLQRVAADSVLAATGTQGYVVTRR